MLYYNIVIVSQKSKPREGKCFPTQPILQSESIAYKRDEITRHDAITNAQLYSYPFISSHTFLHGKTPA